MWKNRLGIFQGIFFKYFSYNSYVEEVAAGRLMVCSNCPKMDIIGKSCAVPGTQPCCIECGCSLEFKLRAMSAECPLGKWKAVMSTETEDKLNK